ncbi:MAG: response regulator [Bacteroidetes bacterium]|nr:MAG: response regulator [Bacteroidota bacterium]
MSNNQVKIIILDDDLFFGTLINRFLTNLGFDNVTHFLDERECLENTLSDEYCVYILDQELEESSGLTIMKEIRKINNKAVFIFLSGQEYCHVAIKAIKEGAIDYIEKNKTTLLDLKRLLENLTSNGYNGFSGYSRLAV